MGPNQNSYSHEPMSARQERLSSTPGSYVIPKKGEPIEKAISRLRRRVDREGTLRKFKESKYHIKRSEKRRKHLKKSEYRQYISSAMTRYLEGQINEQDLREMGLTPPNIAHLTDKEVLLMNKRR